MALPTAAPTRSARVSSETARLPTRASRPSTTICHRYYTQYYLQKSRPRHRQTGTATHPSRLKMGPSHHPHPDGLASRPWMRGATSQMDPAVAGDGVGGGVKRERRGRPRSEGARTHVGLGSDDGCERAPRARCSSQQGRNRRAHRVSYVAGRLANLAGKITHGGLDGVRPPSSGRAVGKSGGVPLAVTTRTDPPSSSWLCCFCVTVGHCQRPARSAITRRQPGCRRRHFS